MKKPKINPSKNERLSAKAEEISSGGKERTAGQCLKIVVKMPRKETIIKINDLKNRGYTDPQIIKTLEEEGLPPREINDSLAQSRIKAAISEPNFQDPNYSQEANYQDYSQDPNQNYPGSIQQPMINSPNFQDNNQIPQAPQPGQEDYNQNYNQEQQNYTDYSQQSSQEQYGEYPQTGGDYSNYAGYQGTPDQTQGESYYGLNTETMSEIAEQIIQEKMASINAAISALAEFKILLEGKVDKMDQRLERIEKIIDSLQTSLIRKSSESSQDVEDIKTEMKLMQNSFSKMLNPLTDKARSEEKHHKHKSRKSKPHTSKSAKVKKHKK